MTSVIHLVIFGLSAESRRQAQAYEQRINTLFRIHNLAYTPRDNQVVRTDIADVQHHVSKAISVAEPSELECISEAWQALNRKPAPNLRLVVDQMRGVFDNFRDASWLPDHIDHSKYEDKQPMAWHMSEAVHHAYKAGCKAVHHEGGIPTQSDAVLIVMLGVTLVSYRQACDKQPVTDAD